MIKLLRFSIFLLSIITSLSAEPVMFFQFFDSSNTHMSNQSLSYSIKPNTSSINDVNRLNTYSAHELAYHFKEYSQEQILNRLDLYSSNEFIKLIKTYPEYKRKIKELHTKFNNLSKFKKVLYRLIGGYSSRLKKRIDSLYAEIEKQNQESNSSSVAQKRHIARFSSERINEYKTLEDVYKTYTPLLSSAIEKRCNVQTNDELQKVLYEESDDIKNRAHKLSTSSPLYDHKDELIDFATAVSLYTNDGQIEKAMTLADFCWTVLDYGQAIVEGAALGLYNSAQDILTNPIEATVCVLAGRQVLAYQLCKVLYNVAEIGVTALHDYDRACEQWNDYIEPVNAIIKAIQNKEITLRDTLKIGTALIVGYKAQTKLLSGLGKIFTTARTKAINFMKNNTLAKPTYYLTTPEGMILKASQHSKDFNLINLQKILKEELNINQSPLAILKDGYYEVNGFKFTEYYYNRLWNDGREAPSLIARLILENAINIIPDPQGFPGFFKYFADGWEMVYNPTSKIVSHLQQL